MLLRPYEVDQLTFIFVIFLVIPTTCVYIIGFQLYKGSTNFLIYNITPFSNFIE